MKREDKNALSRQLILEAALREFSDKGYEGASLNTVWAENGISKGMIYHHFKDKDEIYVLCVEMCFDELTERLGETLKEPAGTAAERLRGYFDARLRFFAENPLYLGLFSDAAFQPPAALRSAIAQRRRAFDELNVAVLTELLNSQPLREGLSSAAIVEDFRIYMDFFNLRFRAVCSEGLSPEAALREHEERCHRQIDILLHGVVREAGGPA